MKKIWIIIGVVLVIVVVFIFRFELFFSYNTIDKVQYRTNRITGDINYFNTELLTWFSQEDIIIEQIDSLQKRIEYKLESKETALARRVEIENSLDKDFLGLFELLDDKKLTINQDGFDGYQVEIERLQQEIKALQLQLE